MTDFIIHIGAPKTGTTAIQQYLFKNREYLAQQGVLYPLGGLLKVGHHIVGAAVFPARADRLQGMARDEALQTSVHAIRKEIEELRPRTVILSSEYLWGNLSPDSIQPLLRPFSDCRISVIAYLRRQDLLAQSLYIQAVKGGLSDSFRAWLRRVVDSDKAGFDFHSVLSSWKNAGTSVEIVARVYEKSRLTGDICSDFLGAVCPNVMAPTSQVARPVNSSPDRMTVELVRLVSSKIADAELRAAVRKRVLSNSPARTLFAPMNYMSTAEAVALVERFGESNARVAQDFLDRPDGILFHETISQDKPENAADPTYESVLERLTELLPSISDRREKKALNGLLKSLSATTKRGLLERSLTDNRRDLTSL
jgi:hypothetical protein